jgi:uncharacterized membrane protein YjjP (DUF1212 family)
MNDPYSRLFKELKEQFPYWMTFLAGMFFGIIIRILREDPWFVGLVWFFIVVVIAFILLGIWFITTKPENRWSVPATVNFTAWSMLVSYTGISVLSSQLTGIPRTLAQLSCIGVVGILALGFMVYGVIKHSVRQNDKAS